MAYPIKVKDYAKTLFLTVANDGSHKYSRRSIQEKITQKFPTLEKIPSDRLISTWANTKDKITNKSWVDLWESGVRHGIQNAIIENEESFEKDEEFEIQVDKVVGLRAGNAIKAAEEISHKLKEGIPLTKEELGMWRESERTFNNLNLEAKADEDDPFDIDYDYLDDVVENE